MSDGNGGASLNIAVVGAGLLGRLLSWRLLRLGHCVSLFEATAFDQPRSAAHTAAAMISPLSEVVSAERIVYDMGMSSLALWPAWLEDLNENLELPVHYSRNGSLVVAHPQDTAELKQFKQDLRYKLGTADPSRWLDRREIAQSEGALSHFETALFLPDEAHLDNRRLLQALLEAIRELGGKCSDKSPVHIDGHSLKHNGSPETFDKVIDCRGMGAKEKQPELRGVRGEVMWVQTAEVSLRHAVRLMHPRYKLYVVPKPGQRFIIGATEIESEDDSPISLQSTLELASALYTINPALAEARVIETDTNLRPAYRNNLPRIDMDGNYIAINGLYRHGYLLAPVLVEHLSDYLTHGSEGTYWRSLLQLSSATDEIGYSRHG